MNQLKTFPDRIACRLSIGTGLAWGGNSTCLGEPIGGESLTHSWYGKLAGPCPGRVWSSAMCFRHRLFLFFLLFVWNICNWSQFEQHFRTISSKTCNGNQFEQHFEFGSNCCSLFEKCACQIGRCLSLAWLLFKSFPGTHFFTQILHFEAKMNQKLKEKGSPKSSKRGLASFQRKKADLHVWQPFHHFNHVFDDRKPNLNVR